MRLETIRREGPPPAALALAGDRFALSDAASRVELFDLSGADPVVAWDGIDPRQEIVLSPSGRHVLLRSATGDALALRRADGGRIPERLDGSRAGPLANGTFVGTPDGELLIASTERMLLRIIDLDNGNERFADTLAERRRAMTYHAFVPTGDPDVIMAIGHYPAEGKDSSVALSVRRLLTEGVDYLNRTLFRPEIQDYAHVLAAGPGTHGEAVCYRVNEDDDEDDDEDDFPDPNPLDVEGIRGYYVRRLADRALVGRLGTGAAPVHELLVGTARHIVAQVAGGVQVIPRDGRAPTLVPATVAAFDPGTARALLGSADTGDLRLLTVT